MHKCIKTDRNGATPKLEKIKTIGCLLLNTKRCISDTENEDF